jgi:hypothetical protein
MDLPKLAKIGEGPYQPKFLSYASIAKGLPRPKLNLAKIGQGPYRTIQQENNNNSESVYEINTNQLLKNTLVDINTQLKETSSLENSNLPLSKQRNMTWVNRYKRKKVSGTKRRPSTRKQRKNKMIGTR